MVKNRSNQLEKLYLGLSGVTGNGGHVLMILQKHDCHSGSAILNVGILIADSFSVTPENLKIHALLKE